MARVTGDHLDKSAKGEHVAKNRLLILQWDFDKDAVKPPPLIHKVLSSIGAEMGFKELRVRRIIDRIPKLIWMSIALKDAFLLVPHPFVFKSLIPRGNKSTLLFMCRKLELWLWERILSKNRGAVFVYDDPVDQRLMYDDVHKMGMRVISEDKSRALEKGFLELFDVLLVLGEEHKRYLEERYGLGAKHFECYKFNEMFSSLNFEKSSREEPYRVGFVSTAPVLSKCVWLLKLRGLSKRVFLYGNADGMKAEFEKRGMVCRGTMGHDDLIKSLNKNCEFGLIFYNEGAEKYFNRFASAKLTSYLLAGIPVLYKPSYTHISNLSREYGIGLSVDNVEETEGILAKLDDETYRNLCKNCFDVGKRLSRGEFTRAAIERALEHL